MNVGLLMSGMASGLGKGVQKGLENYQSYLGASQLAEERNKMEMERLRLTEGFAADREQRGYVHAEKQQKQGFEHAEAQTDKTMAQQRQIADEAAARAENEYSLKNRELIQKTVRDDQEAARKEAEDKSQDTLRQKQGLYYEAYKKYLEGGKGGKGEAAMARVDLDTRKAAAQFYSNRITPLEKQLADPLLSKEERAIIEARINDLSKKGLSALGMLEDEGPAVTTDTIGDLDPYKDKIRPSSTKKSEQPATPAPSAPAERPSPPANLPRMGSVSSSGNLPRMGNTGTVSEGEFQADMQRVLTGSDQALKDFERKYGRKPTAEEMTAARQRGMFQQPSR